MDESKFQLFDAAEYLDSEEAIAEYISEAMQDPTPMSFWKLSPRSPAPEAWRSWRKALD